MRTIATIVGLGSGVAYFTYLAATYGQEEQFPYSETSDNETSKQQQADLLDTYARFSQYAAQHGKSYATKEEYEFRFEQYLKADIFIREQNSMNGSFTVGHNQFSDMTDDEFSKHLGKSHFSRKQKNYQPLTNVKVDASVDWRGVALGDVRNQGQCGSCWTFSGTGVIEAAHYFKTGEIVDLAEQQIVDCQTKWDGCNGGMERDAIAYAQRHQICYESDYPYTAKDGSCEHQSCETGIQVTEIYDVQPKSQRALQQALMQSPTTMAVDAECRQFHYYTGGILDSCCGTSLDHAIMAVGYGTENGQDYWIVRNSWGSSWGEDGYIRIAAEKYGSGVCGSQLESHWAIA